MEKYIDKEIDSDEDIKKIKKRILDIKSIYELGLKFRKNQEKNRKRFTWRSSTISYLKKRIKENDRISTQSRYLSLWLQSDHRRQRASPHPCQRSCTDLPLERRQSDTLPAAQRDLQHRKRRRASQRRLRLYPRQPHSRHPVWHLYDGRH